MSELQHPCYCGRFDVPQCCKRYYEDPAALLVHTEDVCYEQDESGRLKRLLFVKIEVTK